MNRPSAPIPSPADMVLAPPPGGIVTPNTVGGGALPKLNTEAALAPALGMASLGKNVAQTGGAMAELRIRQLEAIGIKQEGEADNAMTAAEADMRAEMALEPDEEKWGAITQRHIERVQGRLGSMEMSRATREAVESKLSRWAEHRSGQTEVESARQSFAKASGAIHDKLSRAEMTGDAVAHSETLKGAVAKGYFTQEAADLAAEKFRVTQQEKARDDRENRLRVISRTQGKAAADAFIAENVSDPTEADVLRGVNFRIQSELIGEDADRLSNAIETDYAEGRPWTDRMAEEWERDNPRITPEIRRKIREGIVARNDRSIRDVIAARADYYASVFTSYARDFDAKRDGWERYWELHQKISLLPEQLRGDVSQVLEARGPNRTQKLPENQTVRQVIGGELDRMLKEGRFGAFDNGTGKNEKGEPVENPGAPGNGEVHVRDMKAWARAIDRKAKFEAAIMAYVAQNPDKNGEQVLEYMQGQTDSVTAAGTFDWLDRKRNSPPAPARMLPVEQDQPATKPAKKSNRAKEVPEPELPETPGPVSNTLIPRIYEQ